MTHKHFAKSGPLLPAKPHSFLSHSLLEILKEQFQLLSAAVTWNQGRCWHFYAHMSMQEVHLRETVQRSDWRFQSFPVAVFPWGTVHHTAMGTNNCFYRKTFIYGAVTSPQLQQRQALEAGLISWNLTMEKKPLNQPCRRCLRAQCPPLPSHGSCGHWWCKH